MNNADKPAYPAVNAGNDQPSFYEAGLTKREYFAAMAMQKMVDFGNYDIKEEVIRRAIGFADELVKQLES
jgi:hypothetical protein